MCHLLQAVLRDDAGGHVGWLVAILKLEHSVLRMLVRSLGSCMKCYTSTNLSAEQLAAT